MATIQRPVKTYGTRKYVDEVTAAPGNEDPILASEVDLDLDTMYAAWNGGVDTVNIKDGAVTAAKHAADCNGTWMVSGATITPTDATKAVVIPSTASANALQVGSRTIKGRVIANRNANAACFSSNASLNAAENLWVQDDAAKSSWLFNLNPDGDNAQVFRNAPGGALTTLLTLDAGGNLTVNAGNTLQVGSVAANNLTQWQTASGPVMTLISNANQAIAARPVWGLQLDCSASDQCNIIRQAPSGGAWSVPVSISASGIMTVLQARIGGFRYSQGGGSIAGDGYSNQIAFGWGGSQITARVDNVSPGYFLTVTSASDERLKINVLEDVPGLAAIRAMRPISFEYRPGFYPPAADGKELPTLRHYGMIAQEMAELAPYAVHDDQSTDHYLSIDYQTLVPLLVNAIKELAARVTAMEGR